MSKKQLSDSDLKAFIQETNVMTQALQEENAKEMSQFLQESQKYQDRVGKLFSQDFSEEERELAKMMKKQGIEGSSADERMSRADQEMMKELEDRDQSLFNGIDEASLLLGSHSYIADNASKKSNSPQEIQELQNFAKGSEVFAQSINNVTKGKTLDNESAKDNKKNIQKLFSTIASGVEKLWLSRNKCGLVKVAV